MLEQVEAGQVSLKDQRLGANYGRAALNLLVQLLPLDNGQRQGINIFRVVSLSKPSADIVKFRTIILTTQV